MKLLAILVAVLGWVPSVGAATLFQSIPSLTANPVVNGYCSPCNGRGGGPLFDTFTVGRNSTVDSISIDLTDGYYHSVFDVSIWTVTAGGLPGTQFFSQSFAQSQEVNTTLFASAVSTAFGTVIVTVNPTALVLSSGTYDISVFGGTFGLGVPAYSGGSGLLNVAPGQSMGFILSGSSDVSATPLPAALPLFATGLGAIGLLGWRRKRKAAAQAAAQRFNARVRL